MEIAIAAPIIKSNTHVSFSAWDAILSASLPVQFTLLILAFLSVATWAIILTKRKHLQELRLANMGFLDMFWKATSLDDIHSKCDNHKDSNIARVFRSGYLELRKMADSSLAEMGNKAEGAPLLSGIDNLERAIRKSIDVELTRLETRTSLLATTGSVGPFIGLFGTVWGIMGAFQKIGASNTASLAVVAPGISEALIATAVGLAAAIPASVGYNYFVANIQKEELELNSFSADFLNIAKRNFFKDR